MTGLHYDNLVTAAAERYDLSGMMGLVLLSEVAALGFDPEAFERDVRAEAARNLD